MWAQTLSGFSERESTPSDSGSAQIDTPSVQIATKLSFGSIRKGGDSMNRKEGIFMVVVLLSTFIGGVFASQNVPAIQQVFVTNFPKNQNSTVTNLVKNSAPVTLYLL